MTRTEHAGWSGPSDDSTCRGSLHVKHHQHWTGPNGWWQDEKVDETVPATYEVFFEPEVGMYFAGDEVTWTGSESIGSSATWEERASSHASCYVPGVDTAAERAAAQAVVVTCSRHDSAPDGSWSESRTTMIRMRRTVCDRSVDSDGDDLADCTEFSLQTETHNPDTDGDGLTDGKEVLTYKTDPRKPDTDDGGVPDGTEIANGTNPMDPSDDDSGCIPDQPQRPVNTAFVARWLSETNPDMLRYTWSDLSFCYGHEGVYVISRGTQDGVVADGGAITTALGLLGQEFKYKKSSAVTTETLTDGSVEAHVTGRFDFCTQIPLAGTVITKGLKIVRKLVPDWLAKRLREWGAKKIFKSDLISRSTKFKIIRKGYNDVLDGIDSLSAKERDALKLLFDQTLDLLAGGFLKIFTDGLCVPAVWEPEVVLRLFPDGTYTSDAYGSTGPFVVIKEF